MIGTPRFDRPYFLGKGSNYLFGYDRLRNRFFWDRRLRLVHQLLPTGRLLDVGCAFGFFLAFLDGRYETYGVDISDYAVAHARRVLRSPDRVRQADVESTIPFSESFDLITAFDVVEHLANPAAALHQCAKALRPGGYLVLEFPTQAPLIHRDGSHHYWPLSQWMEILEQTGFRILQIRGYWTIGLRMVLIPSRHWANYYQVIAKRSVETEPNPQTVKPS